MSGRFCTNCGRPLSPNDRFCGSCGATVTVALVPPRPPQYAPPPSQPVYYSPVPAPRRSRAGLVIRISLIVILAATVIGVAGAYFSAKNAVDSLQPICSSSSDSVNWAGLSLSVLTSIITPSEVLGTIQAEYGIQNPSSIGVNSNWIMQIVWSGSSLSDQEAFSVPAGSTQYVTFHFPITVTTAIQILTGGSTSLAVSLTRDDSAFGFHFTNQITSSSNASSNSTSTLPNC
jgi:RNA polymerase subunit RPABC4/transcription elongation factor Spt4